MHTWLGGSAKLLGLRWKPAWLKHYTERPGRHYQNPVIKVNSASNQTYQNQVPLIWCTEKDISPPWYSFTQLCSNTFIKSQENNVRDILHNNWQLLFKVSRQWKTRKNRGTITDWERTETQQNNAESLIRSWTGEKKKESTRCWNKWTQNKTNNLVNSTVPMLIS